MQLRNSPPKAHLPKFNPEIGQENSHWASAGHLADDLCFLALGFLDIRQKQALSGRIRYFRQNQADKVGIFR